MNQPLLVARQSPLLKSSKARLLLRRASRSGPKIGTIDGQLFAYRKSQKNDRMKHDFRAFAKRLSASQKRCAALSHRGLNIPIDDPYQPERPDAEGVTIAETITTKKQTENG